MSPSSLPIAASDTVFTTGETHGRVLRPGNSVIAHSQDSGWRSLHAANFCEAPFSAREPAIGHPALIYHLARPTVVARRVDGAPLERERIGPRRICLTPGDAVTEWEHRGHPEILQVYLRQSVYERTFADMYGGDGSDAEIVPRFAVLDPLLEQLALAVLAALHDGTAEDGVYIDTIAQLMAAHLARRHSSRARAEPARVAADLSRPRMRQLVDYIEAHLEGDLSLDAMAEQVSLSPLHLVRVFKAELGQSPHRYVVLRRIERAKRLLRDTDASIADVAQLCGFASQSHLSSWFRRALGVAPAAYRRRR